MSGLYDTEMAEKTNSGIQDFQEQEWESLGNSLHEQNQICNILFLRTAQNVKRVKLPAKSRTRISLPKPTCGISLFYLQKVSIISLSCYSFQYEREVVEGMLVLF